MPTFADYTKYFQLLLQHPSNSLIHLWNDYQPKFFDVVNSSLRKQMDQDMFPYFEGSKGICIGGKLYWVFQEYLKKAAKVINVDHIACYPGSPSPDYLTDASNLYFAEDGEFDFVCSSHVLEHLQNPILALKEWLRVLKKGGIVYCAVPDKRFTFDHKRKRTTLQHLKNDFTNGVCQDLTHLDDILINCDYNGLGVSREGTAHEVQNYLSSMKNGTIAMIQPHHHVFIKSDLAALFDYVGLENLFVVLRGNTVHAVGKKIFTDDHAALSCIVETPLSVEIKVT